MKAISLHVRVIALLLTSWAAAVNTCPAADQEKEFIAFSLRAAEHVCRQNPKDPVVAHAGGISELVGFVLDNRSKDLILLGRTSDHMQPFSLDDLVQLLLCAQTGGLSGPGVSLEPKGGDLSSERLEVVFFGGAAGTSLGKVSLEADYLMKKIALDKESIGVDGMQSYAQRTRNRFDEEKIASWNLLSRFWFAPIYVPMVESESGDVVLLREIKVGVLVQTLSATVNNQPAPPDFRDEPAENFAVQFTRLYDRVAGTQTTFADLSRFMGGFKLMTVLLNRAAPETLRFWLSQYQPGKVEIHSEVPLLRDVSVRGRRQLTLVGGVRMAGLTIRLRRGEIAAIRDAILLARPSEQTVTWTIAFDQDWRISTPLVGREDQEIARLFSDALIHQEKRDYSSAIKSLDMVLRAQPDLAEARFLRAVCMRDLAVRSGRIEDALGPLTALRELAKTYPQLAEISYETGVTLRVLGQTDAAIAELTKVVAARPDFAPTYHALGLAYLSKGDKTRTKDHLKEYLRLSSGQSSQYVQEARGTLDNIDNLHAEPSPGKRESKSYVDGDNRFKCQYPAMWKVLGAREARDLLPGMKEAQNVAVVFMDPVKSDNNVNVQIMPISADTLTDQDIKDAIPELDTAYKTRFKNFRKIAAGPINVGGVRGIRYDFACDRAGVPIRQCVVTLVQNKKAYTITFTSQEGDYEIVWAGHIDGFFREFIIIP